MAKKNTSDIQQALYDFNATINENPDLSNKELLGKFPEFNNDIELLQAAFDYSATMNSGKYKDVSEFNEKFPEFFSLKKKDQISGDSTQSTSPLGLVSQFALDGTGVPNETPLAFLDELNKQTVERNELPEEEANKLKETGGVWSEMGKRLQKGGNELGVMMSSIPSFVYDVAAIPQNKLADLLNIPSLKASSQGFGEIIGIDENPVKEYYQKRNNILQEQIEQINPKYNKGIVESFQEGDINTGVRNLIGGIMESLQSTAAIMMSGGTLGTTGTLAGSTALFGAGEKERLDESKPDMSEADKTMIALLNGSFEGLFETTLGAGPVGNALKRIVTQSGKEGGKELAEKSAKTYVNDFFGKMLTKNPALAPMGEGLGEMATTISQNAVNKYLAGDDINITDGAWDAFITGFTMGGGTATTIYTAKKAFEKANPEMKAQLEEAVTEDKIDEQVEKPSDATTQEDIVESKNEIQDETQEAMQEPTEEVVSKEIVEPEVKIEEKVLKRPEVKERVEEKPMKETEPTEVVEDKPKVELQEVKEAKELTTEQQAKNNLISKIQEYNSSTVTKRRKMYQDIQSEIRKQGFDPLKATRSYKKPIKLTQDVRKVARESDVTMTSKAEDFTPILKKKKTTQDLFTDMHSAVEGSTDVIRGIDRKGLTVEEFKGGLRDINNNKPTNRAKDVMDVIEGIENDGGITVEHMGESRFIELQDFRDLIEDYKVEVDKPTYTQKAKNVASFLRKGKIGDDIAMSAVPGFKEVFNGSIEVVATTIEGGGKMLDAIHQGVKYMRGTDWYKKLSPEDQKKQEKGFRDKVFAMNREVKTEERKRKLSEAKKSVEKKAAPADVKKEVKEVVKVSKEIGKEAGKNIGEKKGIKKGKTEAKKEIRVEEKDKKIISDIEKLTEIKKEKGNKAKGKRVIEEVDVKKGAENYASYSQDMIDYKREALLAEIEETPSNKAEKLYDKMLQLEYGEKLKEYRDIKKGFDKLSKEDKVFAREKLESLRDYFKTLNQDWINKTKEAQLKKKQKQEMEVRAMVDASTKKKGTKPHITSGEYADYVKKEFVWHPLKRLENLNGIIETVFGRGGSELLNKVKSFTIEKVTTSRREHERIGGEIRKLIKRGEDILKNRKEGEGLLYDRRFVQDKKLGYELTDKNGNKVKDLEKMSYMEVAALATAIKNPETYDLLKNSYSPESIQGLKVHIDNIVDNNRRLSEYVKYMEEVFYPEIYEMANPVYRRMYNMDMPRVEGSYIPRQVIDRIGETFESGVDLQKSPKNMYLSPPHIKSRRASNQKINIKQDAFTTASRYAETMQDFIAFAETKRDMVGYFRNADVRKAIKQLRGGDDYLKIINEFLHHMPRIKSVDNNIRNIGWQLYQGMALAPLSLNWSLLPKQLGSFTNFIADMPTDAKWKDIPFVKEGLWLKEYGKPQEWKNYFNDFYGGDFVKERMKGGFDKDLSFIANTPIMDIMLKDMPYGEKIAQVSKALKSDVGMGLVKVGDIGAFLGGLPIYAQVRRSKKKQLLKEGKSEEFADKESRRVAVDMVASIGEKAQQSKYSENLSYFQLHPGSMKKLFPYMTTRIQYQQKLNSAFRRIRRGNRDSFINDLRVLFNYGFLQNAIYTGLGAWAYGLMGGDEGEPKLRDDEVKLFGKILGIMSSTTQGMPITYDVLQGLSKHAKGEKVFRMSASASVENVNDLLEMLPKAGAVLFNNDGTMKDPSKIKDEEWDKVEDYLIMLGETSGYGVGNVKKLMRWIKTGSAYKPKKKGTTKGLGGKSMSIPKFKPPTFE